jgi:hypothetical protein
MTKSQWPAGCRHSRPAIAPPHLIKQMQALHQSLLMLQQQACWTVHMRQLLSSSLVSLQPPSTLMPSKLKLILP